VILFLVLERLRLVALMERPPIMDYNLPARGPVIFSGIVAGFAALRAWWSAVWAAGCIRSGGALPVRGYTAMRQSWASFFCLRHR